MGTSEKHSEKQKGKRYEIVILKSAFKQLNKIPQPYLSKISEKIDELSTMPRPIGVEKLTNRNNEYRVRVGTYRIIYSIFDKQLIIEVIDIDHRKQVYR